MKNYVNMIAMMALTTFVDDIKSHPTYGWRICNYAGKSDANPDRRDIYTGGYASYSFADAVMIAAQNKTWQPDNDIWVEPDRTYELDKETELCKWILQNNVKRNDYTTLENISAGRVNLPNGGGRCDPTYDYEYQAWVEERLAITPEDEMDMDSYVESLKNRVKTAYDRFDTAMREGRDEDIDDDYYIARDALCELGINYTL